MEQLRETILSHPGRILKIRDQKQLHGIVEELWSIALDESRSKSERKAAKKALYVAKSQGVDIESARPARGGEQPREEVGRVIQGIYITTADSELLFLLVAALEDARTGSLTLFRFLIHPERGVQKLSVEQSSKRQFQRFADENPGFFRVPEEYGLYKLDRAMSRTEEDRVSGLSRLPEPLRSTGGEPEAGEIRHPVLDLVEVRISRLFNPEYEKQLFQIPEVAGLSLPPEDMREFREEIDAARKSTLILYGKSPDERISQVLERLFSTYFTPERRALYRELLLDIALLLHGRGQTEYARLLVDYAVRLVGAAFSAREHPFLRFLVYREFFAQ